MKKIVILTVILTSIQVNYFAQDCYGTSMISLSDCLLSHEIDHQFIDGPNNTMYLYAKTNANPGLIQSCISQYNADASNCPSAPQIVMSTTKPNTQLGHGSSANWAVGG
ncbi:MAG: hypothetical protein K0S44_168 [Bacteroidetes bacterium]|jgi:hypothetical protein|nr:hypothetical protein [Bacteroidota bacterium]